MARVIVCGAAGRMGRTVAQAVLTAGDMELVGAVEREDHPLVGRRLDDLLCGVTCPLQIVGDLKEVVNEGEVIIDFTEPSATLRHMEIAAQSGKAIVIGTTGFSPEQVEEIKHLTLYIPCVMAPNMSLGANLLFVLAREVAGLLGLDYDVEIVESHHNQKKDAPSGTALRLGREVAAGLGVDFDEMAVFGRHGISEEGRKKGEIGIHAVRGGDIVGEHRVIFAGAGEIIELRHIACSRETFARGALQAARFAITATPGLYDMSDVLRRLRESG